ncbi:hypothetical protein [Erysipelothrix piscisicarius]|nr:hypothetical protein [Erysipelothrix piscisicarius]
MCVSFVYIFFIHAVKDPLFDALLLRRYHRFKRITQENPSTYMKLHKNLMFILVPFILVGGKVLLSGIIILLLLEGMIYLNVYRQYKKQLELLLYEFPMWLRELQCLLAYNTVYQAIKLSYPIAPKSLRGSIKELVRGIEVQPSSIGPYHNFLKDYDSLEVRKVMKVLHRVSVSGTNDANIRLNAMIVESHHWLMFSRNQKKEVRITHVSALGLIPLICVGLLFLLLMGLVVVSLMEGG